MLYPLLPGSGAGAERYTPCSERRWTTLAPSEHMVESRTDNVPVRTGISFDKYDWPQVHAYLPILTSTTQLPTQQLPLTRKLWAVRLRNFTRPQKFMVGPRWPMPSLTAKGSGRTAPRQVTFRLTTKCLTFELRREGKEHTPRNLHKLPLMALTDKQLEGILLVQTTKNRRRSLSTRPRRSLPSHTTLNTQLSRLWERTELQAGL